MGSLIGFHGREQCDALGRQSRLVDMNGSIEKTEPVQHPPNFRKVTAELDHRGGIAGGELGCDLVLVERRWNDGERIIPRDQRDCRGGCAGSQRRNARDDFDLVAAYKAGEYIYKAS